MFFARLAAEARRPRGVATVGSYSESAHTRQAAAALSLPTRALALATQPGLHLAVHPASRCTRHADLHLVLHQAPRLPLRARAGNAALEREMFCLAWGPTLAAVSVVLDGARDGAVARRAVEGLLTAAHLGAYHQVGKCRAWPGPWTLHAPRILHSRQEDACGSGGHAVDCGLQQAPRGMPGMPAARLSREHPSLPTPVPAALPAQPARPGDPPSAHQRPPLPRPTPTSHPPRQVDEVVDSVVVALSKYGEALHPGSPRAVAAYGSSEKARACVEGMFSVANRCAGDGGGGSVCVLVVGAYCARG